MFIFMDKSFHKEDVQMYLQYTIMFIIYGQTVLQRHAGEMYCYSVNNCHAILTDRYRHFFMSKITKNLKAMNFYLCLMYFKNKTNKNY